MKTNRTELPAVPAGQPLIKLIVADYYANQPMLLLARHGVGKSEIIQQAADELGVECRVFDLSIMEPPDLVGMPYKTIDDRTAYAPPEHLPAGGRGILLFEELNRAPAYMRAPCLQLLTARRLNGYQLPKGWVPMAAINGTEDGYDVDELDPALLSRFLRIRVVPEVDQWVDWAKSAGIHEAVVSYVSTAPKIFDTPDSNPRSWTYVGKILKASDDRKLTDQQLLVLISGLVGETSAVAFLRFCRAEVKTPTGGQITNNYKAHRAAVQAWVGRGQLDLVEASLSKVLRFLDRRRSRNLNEIMKQNLADFAIDLPGDLERKLRAWLARHGYRGVLRSLKA